MLSKIYSAGLMGIEAYLIDVEVDIAQGLAHWTTVGLPESSVRESRDRVIAAIKNSGYSFEKRRITINLAPADIKKEGTAFDLPMAIGLMASSNLFSQTPQEEFLEYLFLGELSLQGQVKPIQGALPIALLAKKLGKKLILPQKNIREASVVQDLTLYGVETLSQVVQHLTQEKLLEKAPFYSANTSSQLKSGYDFSEIKGQKQAKRALEVAAGGNHNLLMLGPPGSGKTMLAQRLPTILPPLSFQEALETTKIYSITGLLMDETRGHGPLITERPFRAPHHTISNAGLAGGGSHPRPGEVSLAHHGILFLDELPEFQKNVLEILRQPLESGHIVISRALSTLKYPARFQLITAMNPCKCGFRGSSQRECTCTETSVRLYQSRLSGPLLDRLDIQIEVPAVKYSELTSKEEGECSANIRKRVLAARSIQAERFKNFKFSTNHLMPGKILRKVCALDSNGASLLERAMMQLGLSARAYDRILKVTRTIADLEGSTIIKPDHIAEAIYYRSLDRTKH